jgi:hypothetical protein
MALKKCACRLASAQQTGCWGRRRQLGSRHRSRRPKSAARRHPSFRLGATVPTGVPDMIEVGAPQDAAGTPGAGLPRDCLACGFRTARLSLGGCCSSRCAEFLAAGGPPKSEQARRDDPFLLHPECIGPVGQLRGCDGCGLTFESRGLRLYPDCYLRSGTRTICGVTGRAWQSGRYGGRLVRSAAVICRCGLRVGRKSRAMFCSGRCQRRHARAKQRGFVCDNSARD